MRGDCEKLRQVFLNLLLNGVQATRRGGSLSVAATGLPAGDDSPPFIQVAFSDTGDGMEPAVLERIFDPFYTTKQGGTGLGLSIAQKIIESHGGRIEVESIPGKGTTFRVLLPV